MKMNILYIYFHIWDTEPTVWFKEINSQLSQGVNGPNSTMSKLLHIRGLTLCLTVSCLPGPLLELASSLISVH